MAIKTYTGGRRENNTYLLHIEEVLLFVFGQSREVQNGALRPLAIRLPPHRDAVVLLIKLVQVAKGMKKMRRRGEVRGLRDAGIMQG